MNFTETKRCTNDDRVAVVIVNYFSEAYLAECLAALEVQVRRADRTIVVDNGSVGDKLDAVLAKHPDAELLRMSGNIGFAAANNRAVEAANDCQWIALLNADAFPDPNWLAALLATAARNSECGFFGSKLMDGRTEHLLDGTGDVYHCSGRPWRRNHRQSVGLEERETSGTVGPCAAAALYRRDAWIKVGGLDESYFCYLEDIDLALRLQLAGIRYRYVPEAEVRHLGSAITGRHSDFSIYHGHRNLVWTYFKNMPTPLFWKYLVQHILLNLVGLAWYIARGHGKTIIRSKFDALRRIPAVLKQRRDIQAGRKVSAAEFDRLLSHEWKKLLSTTGVAS